MGAKYDSDDSGSANNVCGADMGPAFSAPGHIRTLTYRQTAAVLAKCSRIMTLWMPVMGSETVTPPRRDARGGRRDRSNLTAKIAEIAERDGILFVFSALLAVMIPSVFVRGRGTSTLRSAATEDGRRNAEQKNSRRIPANLCSAIPRNRAFRARSWAKQFNRRGAKDAARPSRNHQEKDRIMAGQNHKAPLFMVLRTMVLSLLRMILSGHDSVGLLRWPRKSSQLANNLDYCSRAAIKVI